MRPRAILDLIRSAGAAVLQGRSWQGCARLTLTVSPVLPFTESWRIEQTSQQLPVLPGPLASSSRAAAGDDAASVRTGGSAASLGGSTAKLTAAAQSRGSCTRCGYLTSRGGEDDDGGGGGGGGCGGAPGAVVLGGRSSRGDERLCQACTLLEGLRGGIPRVGLVSDRQARRLRAGDAAPA